MEENVKLSLSKNVFYNPAMTLCRSMSSLAVGAIGDELEVVDAFCASGIRGIRYARENSNVKQLTFLDIEPEAIRLAKKNARANKVKADFKTANISKAALELVADFVEIDPFGTPSPYLVDAFRFFNPKKKAYLSVTATDVAVLCGGKTAPCMKNYHSKPLNNEFTHETGLRIMLKRIAEVAAEFNMGIEPLVSFSDKHYLKSVLRLRRSADSAFESMKKLGYLSYDKKTGARSHSEFPEPGMDYAGPLWLGELHNKKFIRQMKKLNKQRSYADMDEISAMLDMMENEVGMPPYYYNVHAICKIKRLGAIPNMKELIEKLRKKGYRATRTHFSNVSIKTDAPYGDVLEAV
jgi:tRNA (guanine26-N2/guanine27-N2)-dimethyltransferase